MWEPSCQPHRESSSLKGNSIHPGGLSIAPVVTRCFHQHEPLWLGPTQEKSIGHLWAVSGGPLPSFTLSPGGAYDNSPRNCHGQMLASITGHMRSSRNFSSCNIFDVWKFTRLVEKQILLSVLWAHFRPLRSLEKELSVAGRLKRMSPSERSEGRVLVIVAA